MDNNFDNTPDNHEQDDSAQPNNYTYTDPNAGYEPNPDQQQYGGPDYHNPQDNYHYNTGSNTGYQNNYDTGMDTSPMSMGDWLLTILALLIPCAGIVLYFVWAFGKNGNINRRNYCRAALIVSAIGLVIYIVFLVIFGFAMIGSAGRFYY